MNVSLCIQNRHFVLTALLPWKKENIKIYESQMAELPLGTYSICHLTSLSQSICPSL